VGGEGRARLGDGRRRAVGARMAGGCVALALGLLLAGCAIPFGNGGEPPGRSPEETRRDRQRLYLEEQERRERERLFDRVGPSDR
jgi:hypothetical protein